MLYGVSLSYSLTERRRCEMNHKEKIKYVKSAHEIKLLRTTTNEWVSVYMPSLPIFFTFFLRPTCDDDDELYQLRENERAENVIKIFFYPMILREEKKNPNECLRVV